MARVVVVLVALFSALGFQSACADPQFTQLAKEGYWVAGSLASSASDPASACLAGEPHLDVLGFYLLVDKAGSPIIKITDDSWSLPPNFGGTIKIAVGGDNYSLPVTSNIADALNVQLTPPQFLMIIGDLESSTSMDLTVANLPLETEPLDGSKDVLTAFLTCISALTASNGSGEQP